MSDEKPTVSEEKVEQIKIELIEEIRKHEGLEKEILKTLKIKKGRGEALRSFFQHPAILLIIGFFLTSIVGALLTTYWQSIDKEKQDAQAVKQNKIKNKQAIADEVSKIALKTHTATSDMLSLYQEGTMEKIEKDVLLERIKYWQDTSREWRERCPILIVKTEEQFDLPEIHQSFKKLSELRGKIGHEYVSLTDTIKTEGWKASKKPCKGDECLAKDCDKLDIENSHFLRRLRCTLEMNNEMKEKTLYLLKEMAKEIKSDENAAPQSK